MDLKLRTLILSLLDDNGTVVDFVQNDEFSMDGGKTWQTKTVVHQDMKYSDYYDTKYVKFEEDES